MKRFCAGVLAVALSLPTLACSQDKTKPDKSPTPAEQLQGLQREQEMLLKELQKLQEKISTIPARMLELAVKHPSDPAALDALVFVLQNPQDEGQQKKATGLLAQHHLGSPKIGSLCAALLQIPDGEKHVRAIIEKNKHREAQGLARFALANHLKEMSEQTADAAQATKISKEAEDLFEQVSKQYADIKNGEATLGEAAKPILFELRNLAIGKTSPDIEGEDSDAKKFKLSDYRGKVVVLDFWAKW